MKGEDENASYDILVGIRTKNKLDSMGQYFPRTFRFQIVHIHLNPCLDLFLQEYNACWGRLVGGLIVEPVSRDVNFKVLPLNFQGVLYWSLEMLFKF
jgi:hypothetical protein